ncbi:UNVERIFIED_CONTAM: hypothetical protein Scaly_3044400 [Sesamum calycinum]|uniref:DUF4283 domain-containing protein n=1 Tax=Sesamum calycinum TaxID=2727403 RepID=A0AAW2K1B9_9LAMI
MSQNSLCSLTHTTHTHNTSIHTQTPNDDKDDVDTDDDKRSDDAARGSVNTIGEELTESTCKINKDFDFNEFYNLATKILNGIQPKNIEACGWTSGHSISNEGLLLTKKNSDHGYADSEPKPNELERSTEAEMGDFKKDDNPFLPEIPRTQEEPKLSKEIFIGNVKLHAIPTDDIAEGFLQSTRKTLKFVPLIKQKGQPIVLQVWEQGMSLRRQKHTKIPVWIRLKHLPMEYWTAEGLSAVASGVGIPLYSDKITKNCSRLDFARVCVILDYNSTLPKHIVVISPITREGKEVATRVDVEYEWLPQRCKQCCSLGHTLTTCPDNKKKEYNPPVTMFVRKMHASPVDKQAELETDVVAEVEGSKASPCKVNKSSPTKPLSSTTQHILKESGHTTAEADTVSKSIMVYNPFDAVIDDIDNQTIEEDEDTDKNSGPNICSPKLGDP